MIDAHCHLDDPSLAPAEATWAEARAVGVEAIVMAGVDPDNWAAQAALCARLDDVHAVFGLHPQLVAMMSPLAIAAALAVLEPLVRVGAPAPQGGHVRPVAIGELGIDRFTEARKAALEAQMEAFRAQLRLARAVDLPVVLHLLRADEQALRVLKEEGLPRAGGVVHSFSGSADFVKQLSRFDLHISFCGTLTFPQSRRLREAARAVAPDRLLVETDSPDQSPEGHRGEVNRPSRLPAIVKVLAELRGWSVEHTAALTAENTRRLFGLARPLDADAATTS